MLFVILANLNMAFRMGRSTTSCGAIIDWNTKSIVLLAQED